MILFVPGVTAVIVGAVPKKLGVAEEGSDRTSPAKFLATTLNVVAAEISVITRGDAEKLASETVAPLSKV